MSEILQGLESVGAGISSFFGSAGSFIQSGISDIITAIQQFVTEVNNGIKSFIGSIDNFVNGVVKDFHNFANSVSTFFGNSWDTLKTVFGDIVNFFKNLPENIKYGAEFIYNELKHDFLTYRQIVSGAIESFVSKIVGFANGIRDIMTYAFSYVRYEFNYMLYYLATHSKNLVGGFLFGMYFNEVKKMKYASLGEIMGNLFFTSAKYLFLDTTTHQLFSFFTVIQRVPKPVPPPIPIVNGIKLL